MRVPVAYPLAGKSIAIKYLDVLDDERDYGDFSGPMLEIRVSKLRCTSPVLVWQTICHELAHATLYLSGVARVLGADREEAVCEAFEHLLAPGFRLNPRARGVRWRRVRFPFEE